MSQSDTSSLDTAGRTLSGWNPEEPGGWDRGIAWRTLTITTFSMVIAFCVFFLVSAIAPKLRLIGFDLTAGQLYWLTAMPGLSGGLIRLIYMFLPPIMGTRRLIGISSLLYLIPLSCYLQLSAQMIIISSIISFKYEGLDEFCIS